MQEIETKDLSSVITVQRRLNVIQRDLGALEDKVRQVVQIPKLNYLSQVNTAPHRISLNADFQSSHEAPRCECLHLIKINCLAL